MADSETGQADSTGPRLSVALSGGGHRATLFSLGAPLYLVDAGCNKRVDSIVSVSGALDGEAAQAMRERAAGTGRWSLPAVIRVVDGKPSTTPAFSLVEADHL